MDLCEIMRKSSQIGIKFFAKQSSCINCIVLQCQSGTAMKWQFSQRRAKALFSEGCLAGAHQGQQSAWVSCLTLAIAIFCWMQGKTPEFKNISSDSEEEAKEHLQKLDEQNKRLQARLAISEQVVSTKRQQAGLPMLLERAEDSKSKAMMAVVENEQQRAQVEALINPGVKLEWQVDPACRKHSIHGTLLAFSCPHSNALAKTWQKAK